jgi:ornithine cyclodeaminase/alanine dehydrogenase-like protein (mu-crystallin family)
LTGPFESIDFAGGCFSLIREQDVEKALPLRDAIADLGQILRETPEDQLVSVPRVRVEARQRGHAWLHTLRGALPQLGIAGGKDYTSIGFETPAMWVTVVSLATGLPIALIEADYLSRIRTAAVTAVATNLLVQQPVETLAHFGVGKISEHLVRALLLVRPSLQQVLLVRRPGKVPLPGWVHDLPTGVEVRQASAEEALRQAEIVTTATSSTTPVIPAGAEMPLLRHLNLVGANRRGRSEIEPDLMRTFLPPHGVVVADDPAQAEIEAGELITLGSEVDWPRLPSLAHLARDTELKEQAKNLGRTAFKSVGVAVMDLAIAAAVLKRLGLLPQVG